MFIKLSNTMNLCSYNQSGTHIPIYSSYDMDTNNESRFLILGIMFTFQQIVLLGLFVYSVIADYRMKRFEASYQTISKLHDDSLATGKIIHNNVECIHQLQRSIQHMENQFVCLGVLHMGDPYYQPFYVEKNRTRLMNDGWLQGNVRYLILSQLVKTQIKEFDIHILFNVQFKIYAEEEKPHDKIDMDVPLSVQSLLNACVFFKKNEIKIKLTGNADVDLRVKTIVYNRQIGDESDSFFSIG